MEEAESKGEEDDETESTSDSYENINAADTDINKDGVPRAVGLERDVDGMRIHQVQDADLFSCFKDSWDLNSISSAVPSPSVSSPSCIRPNEGPIMVAHHDTNCSILHSGPRLSHAMQSQIRDMPAAGCKSIIPATSHQMVLRRRKRKAKPVTSIGSLQQSEDVCEVESESSMDSGIRQGNLSSRQRCREFWKLGFGNVEDLQVLAASIRGQVDRELDDWNGAQ